MNVADDRAFVATAIALGNDAQALQALRAELAQRRSDSGLFDMAGFARDFSAVVEDLARERGWQGAA
jgi:predicted O-linked N-acetylglucosamine transferase (SPINDLY family)